MQELTPPQMGNMYLWVASVLLGVPLLCGIVVIVSTWFDARHNVKVWRQEFQFALEQQCPHLRFDVPNGDGDVYLDAYLLDYQWTNKQNICTSNGRTVRCSCSPDNAETLVMSAMPESEK